MPSVRRRVPHIRAGSGAIALQGIAGNLPGGSCLVGASCSLSIATNASGTSSSAMRHSGGFPTPRDVDGEGLDSRHPRSVELGHTADRCEQVDAIGRQPDLNDGIAATQIVESQIERRERGTEQRQSAPDPLCVRRNRVDPDVESLGSSGDSMQRQGTRPNDEKSRLGVEQRDQESNQSSVTRRERRAQGSSPGGSSAPRGPSIPTSDARAWQRSRAVPRAWCTPRGHHRVLHQDGRRAPACPVAGVRKCRTRR